MPDWCAHALTATGPDDEMALFYVTLDILPLRRTSANGVAVPSTCCSKCGKATAQLTKCSGCQLALYCSEPCQISHENHKAWCDRARRFRVWRDGLGITTARHQIPISDRALTHIMSMLDLPSFASARQSCIQLYKASAASLTAERWNAQAKRVLRARIQADEQGYAPFEHLPKAVTCPPNTVAFDLMMARFG